MMARVAEALGHPNVGPTPEHPPPRTRKASPTARGVPSFANLYVEIDPKSRTCWCRMRPRERPSFTPDLLSDMRALQQSFKKMFAEEPCHDAPLRYVVV